MEIRLSRLAEAKLTIPEAAFIAGVSTALVNREIEARVLQTQQERDRGRASRRWVAGPDTLYLGLVRSMHAEMSPKLRRRFCRAVRQAVAEDKPAAEIDELVLLIEKVRREILRNLETLERVRQDFVESRPEIRAGEPVIKGTRIPARMIADLVRQGASREELHEDFGLTPEQVDAAVVFDRVTPKRGRPRTRRPNLTEHVPADR